MRNLIITAMAVVGLSVASSSIAQNLVLKNCTIYQDGYKSNQTIVVANGVITSVVPASSTVNAPASAKEVDLQNAVVYPGFVDGYNTRYATLPPAPTSNDPIPDTTNTAPPTMWVKNRKGIRADVRMNNAVNWESLNKSALSNGAVFVNAAPGGATVRGVSAFVMAGNEKAVVNKESALEVAFRGGGFGGGGGGGAGARSTYAYPGSLLGVIALARQIFIDADQEKDLEAVKLAKERKYPTIFYANTEVEIDRAINFAKEFNLKLIIAGGRDAYLRIDEIKEANVQVIADIYIGSEPERTGSGVDGPPNAIRAERADLWAARSKNVEKLVEAGIPVAFAGDGDTASNFIPNVRTLISRGLKEADALRILTDGTLFGGSKGSVTAGAPANFTVLTHQITNKDSKVKMLVTKGVVMEAE